MQEADGINFDPVVPKAEFHAWEVILALVVFLGLIYVAVRRSRARSNESKSLKIS